jgi:K+-sensing histidine kinase KdpD
MKNPLFVIQGNLQMMEMNRPIATPESSEVYTQRIARSSRSLLRMILNLLDISRLEQQKMEIEPVLADLNSLVNDIVESLKDIPEHQSKSVHMKLREDFSSIFVDKNIFERVLENCFNYVFQNTPEFMSVQIETSEGSNDSIQLRISHDGKPVPDEFKDKIFLKNAQPELKKVGYKPARGLGLIFCRLAMEAQGGKISLDAQSKDRNTFILEIPTVKSRKKGS